MADLSEVKNAVFAVLNDDATLLALLKTATGTFKPVFEGYPSQANGFPCISMVTLGESPAGEMAKSSYKNDIWSVQISAWARQQEDAGTATCDAITARIEALLHEKGQSENWTTDNFRILFSRLGPWTESSEDGRMFQKFADAEIRAIRNS